MSKPIVFQNGTQASAPAKNRRIVEVSGQAEAQNPLTSVTSIMRVTGYADEQGSDR